MQRVSTAQSCPYAVLGVESSASAAEIKAAYRKLALQWHPDRFVGDPSTAERAEERFKEIGAAWARLGDPAERAKHDAAADSFTGWLADFLRSYAPSRAAPTHAAWRQPPPLRGAHLRRPLTVPFLVAVRGGRVDLEHGGRSLAVTVPAGVETGAKLCLAGEGEPGRPPGNLFLDLTVEAHPQLRRDDLDLHAELPLTWAESAAGGPLRVPTPWGPYMLRFEPLEPVDGSVFTLSGYGVRLADGIQEARAERRGALLYRVRLVAPPAAASLVELAEVLRELQLCQAPRNHLERGLT